MKRTIFFLIAFLAAGPLIIEGCRSREQYREFSEKSADRIVERIADELDLTGAQRTTLEGIKEQLLAKKEQIRNLRGGLLSEVTEQIKREDFNEEELNRSFEQREKSFREIRTLAVSKMGEFHAVLTPQQRERLAEKLSGYSR